MKDEIKALRKSLALTQAEFARQVGISLTGVQKWESGENTPAPLMQEKICRKWNVNPEYLSGASETMFLEPDEDEEIISRAIQNDPKLKKLFLQIVRKENGWETLASAVSNLVRWFTEDTEDSENSEEFPPNQNKPPP